MQNNIKINYYVEIHYKNQKPVVIIASTLVVADHTAHIAGVFKEKCSSTFSSQKKGKKEQKILNHADGPDAACINGMSSLKAGIDAEGSKTITGRPRDQ